MNRRARVLAWSLAALLAWIVGYPLLLTLLEGRHALLEVARRSDEWLALWRSLWISVASTVLAGVLGVPLAFVFARLEFPGRKLLGDLLALPVALPPLVGVIAFLFLYGESGFAARAVQAVFGLETAPWRLQGPGAILLVHAYSMYVYFYLLVRAALQRLDPALEEAAAALGAGRWRTLWRVTMPQLVPAMLGGALLAFMTSLGSFSAPYIFGGNFRVLPTQITTSKLNGDIDLAQAETVALAALALLALWLFDRAEPTSGGGSGVRGVAPERRRLQSGRARFGAIALGWGLALFALLPHFTLLLVSFVPTGTWSTEALPPVLAGSNYMTLLREPERLRPLVNSLWMASLATAAALALGFAAARLALGLRGRVSATLRALIALPWAIPGTVFAVALATAFSVNQPWLLRFVLVGTPVLLPLAYLARSLPLTGRAALAGLAQLDPALEEAAATLGANRRRILWRIVLPLVRPALMAGASIAFITALGDFVASIVLYTYTTRPISIEILSSLRLQDLGVAAAYGVLLMVASGAAFLLFGERERPLSTGA
ncbi:MAG: iron ABC transporter permease [Acidobacteriota bacterium]